MQSARESGPRRVKCWIMGGLRVKLGVILSELYSLQILCVRKINTSPPRIEQHRHVCACWLLNLELFLSLVLLIRHTRTHTQQRGRSLEFYSPLVLFSRAFVCVYGVTVVYSNWSNNVPTNRFRLTAFYKEEVVNRPFRQLQIQSDVIYVGLLTSTTYLVSCKLRLLGKRLFLNIKTDRTFTVHEHCNSCCRVRWWTGLITAMFAV